MRVVIAQPSLLSAVQFAARSISNDATNPVLGGIKVTASDGTVTFESTDLVTWRTHVVSANVEEEGSTVLPGKLMASAAKSLQDRPVTIETDGSVASVRCGRTRMRVNTLDPRDFKDFPEVDPDVTVTIPGSVLAAVVDRVERCVSKDNARPMITGSMLKVSGGRLEMVATDAYRLSVASTEVGSDSEAAVVIPGIALREAKSHESEDVTVSAGDTYVSLASGRSTLVTRALIGDFPKPEMLFPTTCNTAVTVDADELSKAVERASVVAEKNPSVTFAATGGDEPSLTIIARSPDRGESVESVATEHEGDDVTVALNQHFLSDGLRSMSGDVTIELLTPMQPVVLRSYGEIDHRYLLMPVRS